MTRLSPVEGIVIQRDAVPGNLYDNNDVLMVIAPLDHLFVWVNVYEADQARVAMNQEMEIRFPYLDKTLVGKVEYVANEVSKDTRAIQIRASIPNIDGKLKAAMLVRATLKIPPEPGQTVIPRLAMVVMNGNEYAFVQKEPRIPAIPTTSCSSSGASSSSPRSAMTTSWSRPGSSRANTSPPTEAWSLPSSMKTSKWSRPGCRSNDINESAPLTRCFRRSTISDIIAFLVSAFRSRPFSLKNLISGKGTSHAPVRGRNDVTYHDCVG